MEDISFKILNWLIAIQITFCVYIIVIVFHTIMKFLLWKQNKKLFLIKKTLLKNEHT